jgi:hypothetical protein
VHAKAYARIFSLTVILVPMLTGCSPAASLSQASNSNQVRETEKAATTMDKPLIDQVRKFARDEGAGGKEAWKELNAHPRQELIGSLTSIQKATPEGDTLGVDIAFVLCHLDHEYQANRQLIVSAFTKSNRHALDEERLLSRLVGRGDKELLPVLFSAVEWSDGALSEGLSDTFAEQIRSDPEKFLLKLKAERPEIRQKVYGLLDETVMSEEEMKKVKEYLASVPKDAAIAPVATEMLKALPHGLESRKQY